MTWHRKQAALHTQYPDAILTNKCEATAQINNLVFEDIDFESVNNGAGLLCGKSETSLSQAGQIQNITIKNSRMTCGSRCGAVTGYGESASGSNLMIQNIHFEDFTLLCNGTDCGGVLGTSRTTRIYLRNITGQLKIRAPGLYSKNIGGVIGSSRILNYQDFLNIDLAVDLEAPFANAVGGVVGLDVRSSQRSYYTRRRARPHDDSVRNSKRLPGRAAGIG